LIDDLFSRTPISIKSAIFAVSSPRANRIDGLLFLSLDFDQIRVVSQSGQTHSDHRKPSNSCKTASQSEQSFDHRKLLNPCKIASQSEHLAYDYPSIRQAVTLANLLRSQSISSAVRVE
jgi:hypothetical protein